MKKGRLLANAYLVLVFGFLYVPIAVLIAFSFNESKSRTVFTGFTFKWYQNLFHNDICLLYTSPSPRDRQKSRMPSSA